MNCEDEIKSTEYSRQVQLYKELTGNSDDRKVEKPESQRKMNEDEIKAWLHEQMANGIILSDYARFLGGKAGIAYKRLRKARKALGAVAYGWRDSETGIIYWFWKLPVE